MRKLFLNKNCVVCSRKFFKPTKISLKQWNERKTCSYSCSYKSPVRKLKSKRGEDHHLWREKITKKCKNCGILIKNLIPSSKRKYCTLQCASLVIQPKITELSRLHNLTVPKKLLIKNGAGYLFKFDKEHPRTSTNGRVMEHRLNMEKKIGRYLKSKEVVHHWDKNTENNHIENLCLFRTNGAHSRLHKFANRHNIPIEFLKFEQTWLCQ